MPGTRLHRLAGLLLVAFSLVASAIRAQDPTCPPPRTLSPERLAADPFAFLGVRVRLRARIVQRLDPMRAWITVGSTRFMAVLPPDTAWRATAWHVFVVLGTFTAPEHGPVTRTQLLLSDRCEPGP